MIHSTMSETPAVQVESLVKDFKGSFGQGQIRAVDKVSFEIAPGEVYGLIGPNGSGKSTTMKALLGLVAPSEGSCAIFGRDSTKVDSRQDVGFLPENPYFYKHLSGEETIRFYGKLCGMKGKALRDRSRELLNLVGLENARSRRLGGYSKGMLQRIGLAQALVQDPRLLILDEPTAGVDPIGSRQIRDLIFKLKDRGFTVFLCSHLLEQVQEVCDRVGIIHKGALVKEGPLEDLIAIEDQTEVILRNATPGLLDKICDLTRQEEGVELLRTGNSRTTLERLFLRETMQRDQQGLEEAGSETAEPIAPGEPFPLPPPTKASFGMLMGLFGGGSLMGSIPFLSLAAAASKGSAGTVAFGILATVGAYGMIAWAGVLACMYLYRAWKLIQPGNVRTTPGKAIGFLFIPFYNIYWMFIAVGALPADWNRVMNSHPNLSQAPRLSTGLAITSLFIPIVGIFWIASLCKAINFMGRLHLSPGAGSGGILGGPAPGGVSPQPQAGKTEASGGGYS